MTIVFQLFDFGVFYFTKMKVNEISKSNGFVKEGEYKNELFGSLTTIKNDKGDVFFILKEVATILDYSDSAQLNRRLDEDDFVKLNYEESKLLLMQDDIHSSGIQLLTESGLYSAVLESKKSEAKLFKKWITSEVLPSIRKNGMYATENVIDAILNDPDMGIQLLTKLKEERLLRKEAEYTVAILTHVNKTYTSTEVGKEAGFKSAMALNAFLHDKRVQFKQNDTWVLYSNYADLGYVDIKQEVLDNGKIIYHRRWTGIGREFVMKLVNKI